MRRTTMCRNRKSDLHDLVSYRPIVESLEDRLPPGDILFGGMLGRSWLTPPVSELAFAQAQPFGGQAEMRVVDVPQPGFSILDAAARSGSVSSLFIVANTDQAPQASCSSSADAARAVSPGHHAAPLALRDSAGLTEDVLDQLLGDDFEQPSTSAKAAGNRSESGGLTPGSDNPPPAQAGAAGAANGNTSSLAQGTGGPSTPVVPDSPPGGLMGGGGASSRPGTTGAAPATPNLVTDGHFANGPVIGGVPARATGVGSGAPHGTISPFTSGVVWPSQTPPAPQCPATLSVSDQSGGGSGGGGPSGGGPPAPTGGPAIGRGAMAAPPLYDRRRAGGD